jgi:hypothetical protein
LLKRLKLLLKRPFKAKKNVAAISAKKALATTTKAAIKQEKRKLFAFKCLATFIKKSATTINKFATAINKSATAAIKSVAAILQLNAYFI